MSGINEGIKQPLRFYDAKEKQNFRRSWIYGSGLVEQRERGSVITVICPENTIIPFQIRRMRSSRPIILFDLYDADDNYEMDLIANTPGTFSDHMRIIQMQQADNIVWNPLDSFINNIPCGHHYVTVSDGNSTWYSEIFDTVNFNSEIKTSISLKPVGQGILQTTAVAWSHSGNHYELILGKKIL